MNTQRLVSSVGRFVSFQISSTRGIVSAVGVLKNIIDNNGFVECEIQCGAAIVSLPSHMVDTWRDGDSLPSYLQRQAD